MTTDKDKNKPNNESKAKEPTLAEINETLKNLGAGIESIHKKQVEMDDRLEEIEKAPPPIATMPGPTPEEKIRASDLRHTQGVPQLGKDLEIAAKKVVSAKHNKDVFIRVGPTYTFVEKDGQRIRVVDDTKAPRERLNVKHIMAAFNRSGTIYAHTVDDQKLRS